MAQELATRRVALAWTAAAAASVLAAVLLTVCYGALRLLLDVSFPSLSIKANLLTAMTLVVLAVTGGLLWSYVKLPRLGHDERLRIIDNFTLTTIPVLFGTYFAAMAAILFSAKFGTQVANEWLGRQFFGSPDMVFSLTFLNCFYLGVMNFIVPVALLRWFGGEAPFAEQG